MQAETIKEARFGKDAKSLPVVIIEDKISNMMKFMKEYIAISQLDEEVQIPTISEDELDKEAFEFSLFLTAWKLAIGKHANLFDRFRFVYVPPEKPEGEAAISHTSPLRNQRIREWIKAGNETIKIVRSNKSIIPIQLANVLYRYSAYQFFHIEDENTHLSKIITPRSIVVADVDGPLVSQSRVLATREVVLQSAFKKILEDYYRRIFLVGIEEVARYLLHPTGQPGIVYTEATKSEPAEYLLGVGAEYLRKENCAIFFKTILPDRVAIEFRRNGLTYNFEINPELYRKALEALKYNFLAQT